MIDPCGCGSRRIVRATVAATTIAVSVGVGSLHSFGADIDQIDWQDTNAWACAKTIAIQTPKVTGEFRAPQPADAYTHRFAEGLASGLRQRFGEGAVTVVTGSDATTADLVISGEFVTLTTGSRAKRFWVGFGAGKSWADLRLHCVRPAIGSPVFSLRHERGSAMGLKTDESMENVEEITRDVVKYLDRNLGTCEQAAWDRTMPIATQTASDRDAPRDPEAVVPVAFTSNPDGAEVYVDGAFVGTTPLVEFHLRAGTHSIEIRKAGFQRWSRSLAVLERSPTRVSVELQQEQ